MDIPRNDRSDDVKLLIAKQYFYRIRRLKKNMDADLCHLNELIQIMQPCTVDYSKDTVKVSSDGNQVPRCVEAIVKAEQTYRDEVQEYSRQLGEAWDIVDKIENDMERNVVSLFYLDGKSIRQVSGIVKYSPASVCRIRDAGLIVCYDFLPNEHKILQAC